MARKPRVAITVGFDCGEWTPELDRSRYLPYAAAVREAGGEPVPVGVAETADVLCNPEGFLARFDGLLLSGGVDVHPASYPNPPAFPGQTWDEVIATHQMSVDTARDAFELPLAQVACRSGRPVLGICRGFQVLNVILGGQLILDIEPGLGHRAHPDRTSSIHAARVHPGSALAGLLGISGTVEVNSRHHQGVDAARLADRLRASATAADGVVLEAVEAPDHPWLIGVQWHPERVEDEACHRLSRPLFAGFVEACRAA